MSVDYIYQLLTSFIASIHFISAKAITMHHYYSLTRHNTYSIQAPLLLVDTCFCLTDLADWSMHIAKRS